MARPIDPMKLFHEWVKISRGRRSTILFKITFYQPFEDKVVLLVSTLRLLDKPRMISHGEAKRMFDATVHDGTLGIKCVTDPREPHQTFVIVSAREEGDNFKFTGDWFTGQYWGYERYSNLTEIIVEPVGETEAKVLGYVCPRCGKLQYRSDPDTLQTVYLPCSHSSREDEHGKT